jgi:hypothetical protein
MRILRIRFRIRIPNTAFPLTIFYVLQKTEGQCYIWGRKAKFLGVEYVDHQGKKRKSKLLLR